MVVQIVRLRSDPMDPVETDPGYKWPRDGIEREGNEGKFPGETII